MDWSESLEVTSPTNEMMFPCGDFSCGFVKHFFTTSNDVDFVGAIEGEGLGHHGPNTRSTSGDDGHESFGIEEVCCFE